IAGTPTDRRRFFNLQLAQKDTLYVRHLIRYHRALQHRNILLKKKDPSGIAPFEKVMAESALYIVRKREKLAEDLQIETDLLAEHLADRKDFFTLLYSPSLRATSPEEIAHLFEREREKDFLFGSTTRGPHRDDLLFFCRKKEAKSYASEGQKRTYIATLKLAERKRLHTKAFLGVDDFGSHLDPSRRHLLGKALGSIEQVFITLPTPGKRDEEIGDLPCNHTVLIDSEST
ncbi:MAG: hypothetical protein OXF02_08220, partial [Simkaniaceae bacterium]|nr:hypothetical protein [Simkaniaceae bacterium]